MYTELFNPIYATRDGLPVIIVGVVGGSALQHEALVIDDDGGFSTVPFSTLRADVRYDHDEHKWRDVSPDVAERDD